MTPIGMTMQAAEKIVPGLKKHYDRMTGILAADDSKATGTGITFWSPDGGIVEIATETQKQKGRDVEVERA